MAKKAKKKPAPARVKKDQSPAKVKAKHTLFIQRYLSNHFNATDAYLYAFETKDRNSARASASQLLANPNIREEINAQISELLEQGKEQLKARFVDEITQLSFSRLSDYFDDDGNIDFKKISQINPGAIREFSRESIETQHGTNFSEKIKLGDKNKPLELLGKYLNLLTDQVDLKSGGKDISGGVLFYIPSNGREVPKENE